MPNFSTSISQRLFNYMNGLITAEQAGPEVIALALTLNPVFGTSGLDRLKGTTGADVLFGGNSQDFFFGGKGNDLIYTGAGTDYVRAGAGDDTLLGQDGDDRLWGDNENDLIYGGIGNDRVYGGSHNDTLYGEDGNDIGIGGSGNDSLYGGAGNDAMRGGNGDDRLWGGDDNDRLWGDNGNDRISGDAGNDRLYGGNGNDIIAGGTGNDQIYGGKGDDTLLSGTGSNSLYGGDGDDTINAFGSGGTIYGGAGTDDITISGDVHFDLFGAFDPNQSGPVYGHDSFNFVGGADGTIHYFGGHDGVAINGELLWTGTRHYAYGSVQTNLSEYSLGADGTLFLSGTDVGSVTQSGNDVIIIAGESTILIEDRTIDYLQIRDAPAPPVIEYATGTNGLDYFFNDPDVETLIITDFDNDLIHIGSNIGDYPTTTGTDTIYYWEEVFDGNEVVDERFTAGRTEVVDGDTHVFINSGDDPDFILLNYTGVVNYEI